MTYTIVVLISGKGSNLQAIIDASKKGAPYKIAAVISDKAGVYGVERAQSANIPTHVLLPKDYHDRAAYDQALQKTIEEYQPNLIVLAGFMRVLGAEFVNHFKDQIINIHPSLLPKYPGMNTYERALKDGEQSHGATVHFVIAELDAGPIIAQGAVPVLPNDTVDTLQERVHTVEHKLYPIIVQWMAENRIRLEQEKVYLDGQLLPSQGFGFNFNDLTQSAIAK